jgi:hypothetical protein
VTLRSRAASVLLRGQQWFAGSTTNATHKWATIRSWNLRNGSSDVGAHQAKDQDCDPDCTFHGWSPNYRVSVWERDTNSRSRIIKHASSSGACFFLHSRIFAPAHLPVAAISRITHFSILGFHGIHKVSDEVNCEAALKVWIDLEFENPENGVAISEHSRLNPKISSWMER